jgi:hypothetical protein
MRRAHLLAVAALAACATRPGSMDDDVYRAQGAATLTSLECSQRTVTDLGYRLTWYDVGTRGTVRAERRIEEGAEVSRGYLTVSVPLDPGDLMFVTAERISDATRQPVPANPRPRPTPAPTPTPIPVAGRTRPQRLNPGPVAVDARSVLRRCGLAGTSAG